MNKSEIAEKCRMSVRSLNRLLNDRYYDELAALGYKRTDQLVPPVVVRRFFEIWGIPFTKEEFDI